MKQSSDKIFYVKSAEIKKALDKEYRQYFIGQLQKPQLLNYIEKDNLEIGTSLYKKSKADTPHRHSLTSEMLYILKGTYKILLIDIMKEYVLTVGDFFVLPPKTPYASKALPDTQVLFIKTGGNDKEVVSISEEVQIWMNKLD